MRDSSNVLVWVDDVKAEDEYLVGTKAACLADLVGLGFPFPPAFVITSNAYAEFLKRNNLETKIKHLLNVINYNDQKSVREIAKHIQNYIATGQMPKLLCQEIFKAYKQLGGILKDNAVDLEISYLDKHFTGKKLKNIKGESTLLEKIKLTWSSLFSPEFLLYNQGEKSRSIEEYPSIIVSKVLGNSISGMMFTLDPKTQDKTKIAIDGFRVSKKEISIIDRPNLQHKLNDSQIKEIALLGIKLEKHLYFPQEINWAIYENRIYFTKIKPITIIQSNNKKVLPSPLLKGFAFGRGIATGYVKKVITQKDIYNLKNGDIVVTSFINERMLPFIAKAKGLVIDGTIEKHKIYKYFKLSSIPVVTDTRVATRILRDGIAVTINCALGEVYKGGFP